MEKTEFLSEKCKEFLMELNQANRAAEFMMDYDKRQTITVGELMPYWWGEERLLAAEQGEEIQ